MKKHIASVVFVVFTLAMAALYFLLPKQGVSVNEKRVLAPFPKLTASSLSNGSFTADLEKYAADHVPMREAWVGIHAYAEQLLGGNGLSGIYRGSDGYLIAAPEALDTAHLKSNLTTMRTFAESVGLDASIMVVPSTGYILRDKLPSNHEPYWDDALFAAVNAEAGNMRVIDLRADFLAAADGTQLYYRTDHHLTSAGTYRMYLDFCAAMGREANAFSRTRTSGGFYGTGYSRSGLYLTEPDTLEIWENAGAYIVRIDDGRGEETYDSLYFLDHLSEADQYPVFLDGNHALVTIDNPACHNGRRLLLVKDSFAHCFATFAIADYEQICMVDLRYYRGSVPALIESHALNELLYLYGASNLASSTDIPWLFPV